MKKVYLVKRTDYIDYDEYDSALFIAESVEEVEQMIETGNCKNAESQFSFRYPFDYYDSGEREIIEIDLNNEESRLLISSYNAG